jgi:chemotaxis signal transduction protein
VQAVHHQVAMRPMPLGPSYQSQMVELFGEALPVLDLPRRLGVEHTMPPAQRKLVVVQDTTGQLAVCVDAVRDPEEIPASDVTPRDKLAASSYGGLRDGLLAVALTSRGPLPVLEPRGLVSRELLRKVSAELAR